MSRDPLRERSAAWMIGFSSVLVAAGGLALGLQVDARHRHEEGEDGGQAIPGGGGAHH